MICKMIFVLVMVIMITFHNITIAGPPDMPDYGFVIPEYRVTKSGIEWTFPNQLHRIHVLLWNLEKEFTRIFVKEFHEQGDLVHYQNDFQDEFYTNDSSPENFFKVFLARRIQPAWISTLEKLIHPNIQLEYETESHGSIAIKQGGVFGSLHCSFEYSIEHYDCTSFQNKKENSNIAIDNMTSLYVINRKRAITDTFKQGGYLVGQWYLQTSFEIIGCVQNSWDFKDIIWNFNISTNKIKVLTSDVLNKQLCYVRRLCIGDCEPYNFVRELYDKSEIYQNWLIDPFVNLSLYNVSMKEHVDNLNSGVYTCAQFHIKSRFLYFDTISQEQRRFWCKEDDLKKRIFSSWNKTIVGTCISTTYFKWLASIRGEWKVLTRRRVKKNINHHNRYTPEILTYREHLIHLTNSKSELIATPSYVGRIERCKEHNFKKNSSRSFNSLTSTLFSMVKQMVSHVTIPAIEMFNSILVYLKTCQNVIKESFQGSFDKRSAFTSDNTRNSKYEKNDDLFYGENHDYTSIDKFLWNALHLIVYLEIALIHIFLLGYKLRIKMIITFVTNQILNLNCNSGHYQRRCVEKETQITHEAKATDSNIVMTQSSCDVTVSQNKPTQKAVDSDVDDNHRRHRRHEEHVSLSSSVLPSEDEETNLKSFDEHQERNNTFISGNTDEVMHSNTETKFSMQETLNNKLVLIESKTHWEMRNNTVSVFPEYNISEIQSGSFGMNSHDNTFETSMIFQSSRKNGEYWSSLLPVSYTDTLNSSDMCNSQTPVENDESYFVMNVLGNNSSEAILRHPGKEGHSASNSMKTSTSLLAEKDCLLKIKKPRRRHTCFAKHVRRFFKKHERRVLKHNKRRILKRICPRYTCINHNTGSVSICSPAVSRQSPEPHTSDETSSTGTLSSIFDHFSIESSPDDRSHHSEWMRLASFGRFDSREVHAVRLARGGWYSTGQGDQTVCFSCQRVHQNWRRNDNPNNFHDADCSYVNQRSNNIPIPRDASIARDSIRGEEIQNTGETFYRDHSTDNTRLTLSQSENETTNRSVQNEASSSDSNTSSIPLSSELRSSTNAGVPESTNHAATSLEGTKRAQLEALKRDPMGINFDRPKYPSNAILSERVKSFSEWPASMTQTPRDMALAGFFYAGYSDYTRCFFCGGGLRNWEAGDDPWVEHARWFSKCAFVRQNKGQGFIDQVLQRAAELEKIENSSREDKKTKDEKVMQSEAVLCIKRMGYTDEIIRSAIDTMKARLPRGKHKVSAHEILEVVLEMSSSQQTVNKERDLSTDVRSTDVTQTTGDDNSEMGASCLENVMENELTSLELENRNLKGQLVCAICEERNVSIAFLPCGHLTCCEDCAPAMRKCPICREFVRGTVKTFLV